MDPPGTPVAQRARARGCCRNGPCPDFGRLHFGDVIDNATDIEEFITGTNEGDLH